MSKPKSVATFPRNENFYIDDSMVVLLVDGELYRVNRRVLAQESTVFRDMFSFPQPASVVGTVIEGGDDDHPIILPGTSKAEFEALLGYIYRDVRKPYAAPLETSLVLIHVADRYGCDLVYKEAIAIARSHLLDAPPIDRIMYGRDHNIGQWEREGYRDVILRKESLSYQEAERLGTRPTLMLMRVESRFLQYCREHYLAGSRKQDLEKLEALIVNEMAEMEKEQT